MNLVADPEPDVMMPKGRWRVMCQTATLPECGSLYSIFISCTNRFVDSLCLTKVAIPSIRASHFKNPSTAILKI
jgi:hypothetical protein